MKHHKKGVKIHLLLDTVGMHDRSWIESKKKREHQAWRKTTSSSRCPDAACCSDALRNDLLLFFQAVSTDDLAPAQMFGEVYVLFNYSIDSIIVGPLLPSTVCLTMVSSTICPASSTAGRRMDGVLHTAHLSEAGHASRKRRALLQASRPRRGFRGSGASPTRRSG